MAALLLMILLLLLVFSALQTSSSGQYVTEIDDCIRNGLNISSETTITERDLRGGVCGFLMQSGPNIVVQPNKVNISEDSRIRLYLISGTNSTDNTKQEIYEYYTRFLFRNPVFVGAGNQLFALVVLSKNSSRDIGTFEFVFRTNCAVEMVAEDFPTFTAPNYVPDNPMLTSMLNNASANYYCSYNISSRNRNPFAVKFTQINDSSLYINNTYVNRESRYVFNGDQTVTVSLQNYYYFYYYNYGPKPKFAAKVSLISQTASLQPLGGKINSGIAQIIYKGKTFSLEYGSMSLIDLHVFCLNLNYGGLEDVRPYETINGLSLISHDFQCVGAEKDLSQCSPLMQNKIGYRNYYYRSSTATVVTCSDKFPVRLEGGTNSTTGIVQVRIGKSWYPVCADNMDTMAGNVFCREMGYTGALEAVSSNTYYWNYQYSSGMSNVRCGNNKNLRDCSYEISQTLLDNRIKMNDYQNELYSYSKVHPKSYINGNIRYFSYCYSGAIRVTCKESRGYVLTPHSHQGFLQYDDKLACSNDFHMNNAAVYCRYLGYPGIRAIYQNASFDTTWFSPINLQCRGYENSPADCPIGPVSQCKYNQTMGITCQDVALAGSNSSNEGRVDIYYKGRRGLLCDDFLTMNTGNVICRQLGFSFVANVTSAAGYKYGFGNGVYILNRLYCNGYENSIQECNLANDGHVNCGGNEVSGIVCEGQGKMCGFTSVPETPALSYDGYKTRFGANPWQVRLIPYTENEWCSGTILNNNWILTSANCFGLRPTEMRISISSPLNETIYSSSIQQVIIHPEYSSVTGEYNIALVKTWSPIRFDANVQPICRGPTNESLGNERCWTTGWNHRQTGYNRPLMGKLVTVMSNEYCMSNTKFDASQMSRYLCSQNSMNKLSIFNGESGGPLICNIRGTNTIVGVVARSVFGARATSIRLYAKVEAYSNWIDNTMARY